MPDNPVSLFISYSHLDDKWRLELDKSLSLLKREGLVSVWHDRRILPGEEWKGQIDLHLETADLILLLISSNFLASDYCYEIEMKRAMERHDAGEATVIPIIIRPSDWPHSPFSKCQVLPKEGKAITTWKDEDEAFLDVVNGIRATLEKLRPRPSGAAHSDYRPKPNRRLLPYLCDRSEQELALVAGLDRHQQQGEQRPIVLLIHGDELECHGSFIERLQYVSLPKYFNLESKSLSVRRCQVPHLPNRPLERHEYWAYLGEALLKNFREKQEEICDHLAQYHEPHLIVFEFLTNDLAGRGFEPIQSILDFCAGWPDLPPGRLTLPTISLKYQRYGQPGFFDFKRRKLRQLNEDLRRRILRGEFSCPSNLTVIALPELEPIPQGDVETWRSSENIDHLPEREIRSWFKDRTLCDDRERIPMDLLADKLKSYI